MPHEKNPHRAADGSIGYDRTTIWLHWLTVGLVAVLWGMGQTTDLLPRGPFRAGVWATHVVLGAGLALVLVARLVWRARFGRELPPADAGVLHFAAKATHYVLYGLLAAAVVSGAVNASYRGFNLFDLWSVPQFGTGDVDTRHEINGWHELAANLLALVVVFHAGAALLHHYLWKDHLLDRMRTQSE
ncbi:cytochrome b [Hansschlegelia sp.]|uniref:cytochrome b n=1 Tax=Hansschlegelia sp. TaxID=2041892 RepID=UPI002C4CB523|nr:cytochrome b/b6 domain-containing protein [Hansschlegelia sp.]HVI27406.1 cytochrome b/b6 domain-containing protein [Hansschlegelia sp.]